MLCSISPNHPPLSPAFPSHRNLRSNILIATHRWKQQNFVQRYKLFSTWTNLTPKIVQKKFSMLRNIVSKWHQHSLDANRICVPYLIDVPIGWHLWCHNVIRNIREKWSKTYWASDKALTFHFCKEQPHQNRILLYYWAYYFYVNHKADRMLITNQADKCWWFLWIICDNTPQVSVPLKHPAVLNGQLTAINGGQRRTMAYTESRRIIIGAVALIFAHVVSFVYFCTWIGKRAFVGSEP